MYHFSVRYSFRFIFFPVSFGCFSPITLSRHSLCFALLCFFHMTNERNTCAVCTEILCVCTNVQLTAVAMPHLFGIENNNNLARALIPFYCAHTTHMHGHYYENMWTWTLKDSKADLVIQTQLSCSSMRAMQCNAMQCITTRAQLFTNIVFFGKREYVRFFSCCCWLWLFLNFIPFYRLYSAPFLDNGHT